MNSSFYKNLALWIVIGLIVIVLFNVFQFNVFQASEPSRDKMVFSDFLKRAGRRARSRRSSFRASPSPASSPTATRSAPSRRIIPT